MKLVEAVSLIQSNHLDIKGAQIWADLGCGNGLFSQALLSLLPEHSQIYAVDQQFYHFEDPNIHFIQADFIKKTPQLPPLNGILMANSLHFVADKLAFLEKIKLQLSPKGAFLLIEYDVQRGNQWVPYPLSYTAALDLFKEAGFQSLGKLNEMPSLYNRANIYSALFIKLD